MKRLLLLCFLACASCTVAMAQTSTPSTQTDLKILFNSGVSQYEAGILRSNQTLASTGFTSAMNVITTSISQLQQQMNAASSQANKAAIAAKIQAQSQVQTDLQALQSNIMTNATQIQSKFGAFKALM